MNTFACPHLQKLKKNHFKLFDVVFFLYKILKNLRTKNQEYYLKKVKVEKIRIESECDYWKVMMKVFKKFPLFSLISDTFIIAILIQIYDLIDMWRQPTIRFQLQNSYRFNCLCFFQMRNQEK